MVRRYCLITVSGTTMHMVTFEGTGAPLFSSMKAADAFVQSDPLRFPIVLVSPCWVSQEVADKQTMVFEKKKK